jgi:hypothetical protein
MITMRKIRAHYGVKYSEPWLQEKHELGPLAPFAQSHK